MPPLSQCPAFQWVNLAVILANTAVMASARYPMPSDWDAADDKVNAAFTAWFATEMAVKLAGLGLRAYLRDGMNRWVACRVGESDAEWSSSSLAGVALG